MRFYLYLLSFYAIASTALIVILSLQNANLKHGAVGPQPTIDFASVRPIPLGDAPSLGPADAPVTLVLFSDYECPFCAKGSEAILKLMAEYPGKIRWVMKHFPLKFHPQARPAAAAAMAAHVQGKFWDMHHLLHAYQDRLGEETYLLAAESLGLDMNRFVADMQLKNWDAQIQADLDLATEMQLAGTPTLFFNGVLVPPSYDFMKQATEHFLAKSQAVY